MKLTSGVDERKKPANRDSRDRNITMATGGLGEHYDTPIASKLAAFRASLAALTTSDNAVRNHLKPCTLNPNGLQRS